MPYLRLRQICLVAPSLAPAEADITAVLGVAPCFRDPLVGQFGLENALWPVGDMLLEVVAPTRAGTAAGRFLERSHGRGGYMVIFDCDDPDARAAHAKSLGVALALRGEHDDYLGAQLHPRDCRAAMIEFNRTRGGDADPFRYAPAGAGWRNAPRSADVQAIADIVLTSPKPQELAAHWGAIAQTPVAAASPSLHFKEADIVFAKGETERMDAIVLRCADPAKVAQRARTRGLAEDEGQFTLSGIGWSFAAARG